MFSWIKMNRPSHLDNFLIVDDSESLQREESVQHLADLRLVHEQIQLVLLPPHVQQRDQRIQRLRYLQVR